jgi:ATP-dependent RNA helicase RhlE
MKSRNNFESEISKPLQTKIVKFEDFNFNSDISRALADINYSTPTPIQEKSISHILQGRDVLGLAQTGTGKTAAFVLPILQDILDNPRELEIGFPRAVILVPNRELCQQIVSAVADFSKYIDVSALGMFGGAHNSDLILALEKKPEIIVATPGKLLGFVEEKLVSLKGLDYFVLDEVDRMLDVASIFELKKVIKLLPKKRQSLFFSATITESVTEIIDELLCDPVRVEISRDNISTDNISQNLFYVAKDNKFRLLVDILNKKEVKSAIIFINSRKSADNLVRFLSNNNIKSEALHAKKSDVHRDKVINNISFKDTKYLIATDLGSRGLDIDDVSAVVNFDLPTNAEVYVHRIGRCGRAGKIGHSYSLCSPEEKHFLNNIEAFVGKPLVVEKHEFHLEKARTVTGSASKPKYGKKDDNKNKYVNRTVFKVDVNEILKAKNANKKKKRKSKL